MSLPGRTGCASPRVETGFADGEQKPGVSWFGSLRLLRLAFCQNIGCVSCEVSNARVFKFQRCVPVACRDVAFPRCSRTVNPWILRARRRSKESVGTELEDGRSPKEWQVRLSSTKSRRRHRITSFAYRCH